MKNLVLVVLLLGLFLCVGQQIRISAQTCDSSGRINGIHYTSCFPRLTGESSDRPRLQRAIDAITSAAAPGFKGGKLIFNESNNGTNGIYEVDGEPIILRSYIILEGIGLNSSDNQPSSRIKLTSTGSIFKIGENVFEVSIRDLAFSAASRSGTTGILAEGKNTVGVSQKFQFSNIKFTGFERGIFVNSLERLVQINPPPQPPTPIYDWQFDNVRLDHATFETCTTGIEINAANSGWSMTNVVLYVPKDAFGIKITRGGYISMNLIIGNGPSTSTVSDHGDTFIYIREHSVINIQNSTSENVRTTLNVDGISKIYPIFLANNIWGKNVIFKDSTIVSTGNSYAFLDGVSEPEIRGYSDVFSTGDVLCVIGTSYCPGSKFKVVGINATLFVANSSNEAVSSNPEDHKPVLEAITALPDRQLLKLGQNNFFYTMRRDSNNGFLVFKGNQNAPYTGFKFDKGPVQLHSVNFGELPSPITVNAPGSLLFCSNCQPNTTPCEIGNGGGALAIQVNGQWNCK